MAISEDLSSSSGWCKQVTESRGDFQGHVQVQRDDDLLSSINNAPARSSNECANWFFETSDQQWVECERPVKQDYLNIICQHGQALLADRRASQWRGQMLSSVLLKPHVETEKEEQKQTECISKERLQTCTQGRW